jgi:endonuclease/exonuclease/phosphatase family metal-dependent hydrolase
MRKITVPLALAAATLAAVPTAASAAKNDVTVMSRNLYLGTDLIPPALAPNLDELKKRVTQAQRNVEATNFPTRAKRIAAEIAKRKPDLVGLQEVTRYRTGPQDGGVNASNELYDWMKSLQKELGKRKQRYKIVVRTTVADVEVPSAENTDLRITIGDAILARKGKRIKLSNVRTGSYDQTLKLTLANGQAVDFARTWESVDGRVAGRRFRFVNTHLEAFGDDIRTAQAKELVSQAPSTRPTILVGDLNSDPNEASPPGAAFDAVAAAGFRSAFSQKVQTSGFNELVNDPDTSGLTRHIDHILYRGTGFKSIKPRVVGNTTAEKINGLWPSDHAGVVATLRVPKK